MGKVLLEERRAPGGSVRLAFESQIARRLSTSGVSLLGSGRDDSVPATSPAGHCLAPRIASFQRTVFHDAERTRRMVRVMPGPKTGSGGCDQESAIVKENPVSSPRVAYRP